jgi:DNA topoisomerase-1
MASKRVPASWRPNSPVRRAQVTGVETVPRSVHPRAPFITSTLQQTAFNRLGYTAKRTMALAQQLYEGIAVGSEGSIGLITYMRTDAPRLADEAIVDIRGWLSSNLGADYVPESPRQFKSKKGAQEAHEAIRPSSVARTPESLRPYLNDEQFRLYDLIWKRAVASQTASAEYEQTTLDVESGRLGLRASGRVLKFPGFQKLYGLDEEDEAESRLPEVGERHRAGRGRRTRR